MSRKGKWVLEALSLPVFFFLDILDFIACFLFRLLDGFFQGKTSSCYCSCPTQQHSLPLDHHLSQTLYSRKNTFRDTIGFLNLPTFLTKAGPGPGPHPRTNTWSDCACQSCLSCFDVSTLHVLVKQQQTDKEETNQGQTSGDNVIFLHGFLSSSSLWKETVFHNLSKRSTQNYRLFAVDLLGFGRSPKPRDCAYTLGNHVEMIERSVIVPFELNSFHLVAHSMGCVIALALAAKHSASVKTITLVAPPYFSASRGDATAEALRQLAPRRVWPPLLFFSAFMTWYEHLGRCMCFLLCRNHRFWEWILKLVTRRRDLHFQIMDVTRHTHHSAWHTMHNVVCGGARFLDGYLEVLRAARVRICVVQGRKDEVVLKLIAVAFLL